MAFPKTLQEFQAAFPDEEACWDRLRRARWPGGLVCPRCAERGSSWISTRRLGTPSPRWRSRGDDGDAQTQTEEILLILEVLIARNQHLELRRCPSK